ncbi:hypothetical protein CF319_g7839, partial [Tilletia indica]
ASFPSRHGVTLGPSMSTVASHGRSHAGPWHEVRDVGMALGHSPRRHLSPLRSRIKHQSSRLDNPEHRDKIKNSDRPRFVARPWRLEPDTRRSTTFLSTTSANKSRDTS